MYLGIMISGAIISHNRNLSNKLKKLFQIRPPNLQVYCTIRLHKDLFIAFTLTVID